MKRAIVLLLFLVGLGFAVGQFRGAAATGIYDSVAIDFQETIAATELDQKLATITKTFGVTPRLNSEFSAGDRVYVVNGDRAALDQLLQWKPLAAMVESAQPNYQYFSLRTPNDPDYGKQWNLRSINVERAWEETDGSGVVVAVIDTGISPVPDLEGVKFTKGYDFVNDREDALDDAGHGTHVAGTIAQATNNGYGVAGVAHGVTLMPLKVLGASGGGTVADIAEAIRFAADNGADVINMSLGGAGESALMREAIDYAHGKGVVLVAAAGNANANGAGYPARYPKVIGVAATGPTGVKSAYSNYGAGIDLSAPGGDMGRDRGDRLGGILQETINPANGQPVFESYQGTSMASPHVAAVAALVKSVGVTDPAQVTEVLTRSARSTGEDPLNHYGAGQLDAAAAVELAQKGQITPRDFFRWVRDNGYLNPKFWIDGGAVALLPKLAMVIGSYLLAWLLRNYFPFRWSWAMAGGLVAGSSGVFGLRGVYLFDAPQWPLRVLGSSIAELGTAISGNPALNPIFASVAIPAVLIVLLLGHPVLKRFAVGTALGMAACLGVSAIADPQLLWLGSGAIARGYLLINGLLCLGLGKLAAQTFERPIRV